MQCILVFNLLSFLLFKVVNVYLAWKFHNSSIQRRFEKSINHNKQ